MENLEKCPICSSSEQQIFIKSKDYFLTNEEFTIVECKNCGFRFVNPRPTQEKIGKYYETEEYVSHSNTKKGIINLVYAIVKNRALKNKYKLVSQTQKGKEILDIGCGPGDFLSVFKTNGWNTYGIEPNKSAREIAKKDHNLNVFSEDELETFSAKKFDVITLWHVLEHVHTLNSRIEKLKSLLKDDGLLVVAVPNCASYDATKYGKFWAAYDLPRHIYHFRQSDIKTLFSKHGMKITKTIPMKYDSYYISLLSEKYKTGKQKICSAFFSGLKSNLKANRNGEYSSLIYFIRKNQ